MPIAVAGLLKDEGLKRRITDSVTQKLRENVRCVAIARIYSYTKGIYGQEYALQCGLADRSTVLLIELPYRPLTGHLSYSSAMSPSVCQSSEG